MIIFIAGGVKGGKSMFAQCISKQLVQDGKLFYLATMMPYDNEDRLRIERHILDRAGWGFDTIEEGMNFDNITTKLSSNDVILLDSVTAYVQNNLFDAEGINYSLEPKELAMQIKRLSDKVKDIVIVSDYIFSDSLIYQDATDLFKKNMGNTHIEICKYADVVLECAFSRIKVWKNDVDFDFNGIYNRYYDLRKHLMYGDI